MSDYTCTKENIKAFSGTTTMPNTMNKTSQSRTGSDTPETDALHDKLDKELAFMCERDDLEAALVDMLNLARKLERERDEARFDLAFRRDLYRLQEFQLDELRKQLAEAVSSCNIWQKGHSALVEDRNKTVLDCHQQTSKIAAEREGWKKIAVEQEKQIAKQLTLLQEHGLAEYGN